MIFPPHKGDIRVEDFIREWVSPDNICLQSEDFSTTWSNFQSVDTQAQGIAPDGLNTANKITDDSGGGTGANRVTQNITFDTSTIYTFSAYAKQDQLAWLNVKIGALGALAIDAYFDLGTGATGTKSADATSSSIEDAGNGWFRCSLVFTSDASDTSGNIQIIIAEDDNDNVTDRDGTSSIFVWGAQLEASSALTRYSPTTTVATKIFPNGNINLNFKKACGAALGFTDAQIAAKSIDDIWKNYLITVKGLTFIGNHVKHYGAEADFTLPLV